MICASPALLAAHGVPGTPEDLPRLSCITCEAPTPALGWRLQPSGSRPTIDIPVIPRLSVTTAEAAAEAAIRGVGVARLLHYQVADAVAAGKLLIILEDFEPEPAPIHLVHAARGQMPLKMRRFLDFAAPRLREALRRIGPDACAPA